MENWEGQISSTAFDSAESPVHAAVQRMIAIDVKYKSVERFQIFIREEKDDDRISETLINSDMKEFREESRIWRFERMLENSRDFWIVSDITG
jgi:hypothetical protein